MSPKDPYLLLTTRPHAHQAVSPLEGFVRTEGDAERGIGRFGRVGAMNVFVGPNNAGKSRIMRQLFSRPFVLLEGTDDVFDRIAGLVEQAPALRTLDEPVALLAERLEALFTDPEEALRKPVQLIKVGVDPLELILEPLDSVVPNVHALTDPAVRHAVTVADQFTQQLRLPLRRSDSIPRAFVPTLRSTLRVGDSVGLEGYNAGGGFDFDADPLQRAFVDAYGLGRGRYHFQPSHQTIFTGSRLYEVVDVQKREALELRRSFERFEAFLATEFFGGVPTKLVARNRSQKLPDVNGSESPHVILEVEVGERSTPLQQYGDGVSTLLTLLAPLFLQPEGSWIFIEEPENHLHPGLQRRFIEVAHEYGVRERKHRLFLTTHSNHVLEAIREVEGARIFRVERVADADSGVPRKHVVAEVPHATVEMLDDLGATAASVLQARSLVWVEGPSDVHYLRALLRLAQDAEGQASGQGHAGRVLEGRDFAFVSYGGALLATVEKDEEGAGLHAQLGRIVSVGLKSMVIADRDGPDKASTHQERTSEYHAAGVRYEVTAAVEIENELGAAVWNKLLPQVKPRNWKGEANLDAARVRTERLGALADEAYKTEYAKATGGTLRSEEKGRAASKFAEMVRSGEVRWDDVSLEAQELARKVLEFVRSSIPKNPAL